jgi:hypothetical protein
LTSTGQINKTLAGQNILAVTVRIGNLVIPLVVIFSKQGRGNTQKPQLLIQMLSEVINFFSNRGVEITDYPITFDSWYGSQSLSCFDTHSESFVKARRQSLREELETLGFSQILVHAKSNYVFIINVLLV